MLRLEKMCRSVGAGGKVAALMLLPVLVFGTAGVGHATDAFFVNYFINANVSGPADPVQIPTDTLYVANANGVPPAFSAAAAPLCAMIYVFDPSQELEECCGCKITHAGELVFSVNGDLAQDPVTAGSLGTPTMFGIHGGTGTIKIVLTNANTGTAPGTLACDPTDGGGTGSPFSFTPTPTLRSWITHNNNNMNPAAQTEEELLPTGEPDADFYDVLDEKCTVTWNTGGVVTTTGTAVGPGACICPPAS